MLQRLHISNYALIEQLDISFGTHFSAITGETGAGKSIILGALNLLLGQRADTSVLKNEAKKSVVEGHFSVSDYHLESLFETLDLDYDDLTIFRREIWPSGKTRAFINDVPVTLNVLKNVASRLVDIHSQDHTHALNDKQFQMKVVDIFADNALLRADYGKKYQVYRDLQKKLSLLEDENAKNSADLDYFRFQLEQLQQADLQPGEQVALEQEQNALQHAEAIQSAFFTIYRNIEEEGAALDLLNAAFQAAEKSSAHHKALSELAERLNSALIELRDLSSEAETLTQNMEFSPERSEKIAERLSLIYELQQKHRTDSVEGLLVLQEELAEKVQSIDSFDENIQHLKKEIEAAKEALQKCSEKLSESRKKACLPIVDFVAKQLQNLGMPHARLEIDCLPLEDFLKTGKDAITFQFSANKNIDLQDVGKVASGGEKSRLMFVIKLLLAQKEILPTLIFDEIDSGVSGEVARKMGMMMRKMGEEIQVVSITHLPQVASCANEQYKVFKYDETEAAVTQIVRLSESARLEEIARLLSGDAISEAALKNANDLLAVG